MKIILATLTFFLFAAAAFAQQPQPTPQEQAYGSTILELTQSKVSLLAQIYKLQAEIDAAKKEPAKPAPETPANAH